MLLSSPYHLPVQLGIQLSSIIQPALKFHFNFYSTIILKLIIRKILKIPYTCTLFIFKSFPIDLIVKIINLTIIS